MKTYALLIAINNYRRVPKLSGCINDIEKVENYIYQNMASCKVDMLVDDKATKKLIVDTIGRISQEISNEDSFLLYYSGHGTQEKAGSIWNETDGRLECIVCYDEDPDKPYDYLLCDKELRYLIYKLSKTGCHIVTVFDCCHSGDNTRNAKVIMNAFDNYNVKERRLGCAFPERRWEDFLFHNAIKRDEISGKDVNEFLPQGSHIQIAACESDESAMEVNGEGVFTKTLLKVLADTGGSISYYDLKSRIRQYLRFVYEQQPRIYTVASASDETHGLLFKTFLNNQDINQQKFVTEAVYNKAKGWLLNLGAIHGISKNTIIYLCDPVSIGKSYCAFIREIFVDYSLIEPAEKIFLSGEHTVLKAKIEGIELCELKLHVKRYGNNPEKIKGIADALINGAAGHYILTEDEDLADYTLHVSAGLIYITQPKDQYRPLVEPIEFGDVNARTSFNGNSMEYAVKHLVEILKHVSRWSYTRQLKNNEAGILINNPIHVNISQVLEDGTEITFLPENERGDTVCADLKPAVESRLRIRLTNKTNEKFFVAAVYLTYNFQAYMHLLERKVEVLHPGESVSLKVRSSYTTKNDLINLHLPDVVKEYNWPGYKETIKIIVSQEEFSPEALSMAPLPSPYVLKDQLTNTERSRSLDIAEEKPVRLSGWITQTVQLKYPNVFYNNIEPSKIDQLLAWDRTAFFAKGLYDCINNGQEMSGFSGLNDGDRLDN